MERIEIVDVNIRFQSCEKLAKGKTVLEIFMFLCLLGKIFFIVKSRFIDDK